MCEILVRLFDKYEGTDQLTISKSTERGDVIVVADDGWNWSEIERTSYNWIILSCPASKVKASTMRASEPGNALENPYLRILIFKFDLEALILAGNPIPSAQEAKLGYTNKEKRPIEMVLITEAVFDATKTLKARIEDPAVIG